MPRVLINSAEREDLENEIARLRGLDLSPRPIGKRNFNLTAT